MLTVLLGIADKTLASDLSISFGAVEISANTGSPTDPIVIGGGTQATETIFFASSGSGDITAGGVKLIVSYPVNYVPTGTSGTDITGTLAALFNWSYDAGTRVLTGTSNTVINSGNFSGDVVVSLKGVVTTWDGVNPPSIAYTKGRLNIDPGHYDGIILPPKEARPVGLAVVDGPTPVKLLGFTASKEGSIALLRWGTAEEVNVDRFEILQSLDAKNWRSIASVDALGESTTDHWYSFNDANPANGTNYYRIKSVDRDGATDFSNIQSLEFEIANAAAFYPNPVAETLKLKGENLANVNKVTVLNMMGGILVETSELSKDGINVSHLPAGSYIVRLERKNGSVNAFKVVKQ
ncbi:T9SS type A sorting domain-containing protein [Marinilongibacter aquaticus]|uniref:T9SS type A sorting domain-containing protein n=1 Tax=Marinilongibacter aquaticus TaxID=2975157 RepID=UPI0021BDAA53|nr:T9SS type A sorting domain-containing protein [Marinilongibacter aquaticus]UBM60757.1 T9SS type A sorting domain-containing protein [Marinilongibacter aquaticus]